MRKILIGFLILSGLVGCASTPTGPAFSDIAHPKPTDGRAMLVFFRDYAEPKGLEGMILIDGEVMFGLPQKSFAYSEVSIGPHDLQLKWPALSGMPGWQGSVDIDGSRTYYFELTGTSTKFVFHSKLSRVEEPLAKVNAVIML